MSTSPEQSRQSDDDAPHVGGVRAGPKLASVLYLLLIGSAALALWTHAFPWRAPVRLTLAAPWVFLTFLLGFSAYRFLLVSAKKYPAGKAFFQIGAAALFFMLLLPGDPMRSPSRDAVEALLRDANPAVRAMAAEVARYRTSGLVYARYLVRALSDPNAMVRAEAHRSLVALTGADLGAPEDPEAVRAWAARYP